MTKRFRFLFGPPRTASTDPRYKYISVTIIKVENIYGAVQSFAAFSAVALHPVDLSEADKCCMRFT